MNRVTESRMRSFAHGFSECWMSMNRPGQLIDCALEFQQWANLGDKFGGMGSNDMHAQDLIVFCFGDDLDETRRIVDHLGFADGAEGKLANLEFVPCVFGLRFRQSKACNLWIRIGAVWHLGIIDGFGCKPSDVLDGNDGFVTGCMSELWRARYDITNGIHAWFIGLTVSAHMNKPAFDFDFRFVQANLFGQWPPSNGNQALRRLDDRCLSFRIFKTALTRFPSTCRPVHLVDVCTLMPRFLNARANSLETSGSSSGTSRSWSSTMVTSDSKLRKTLANSTPTAPAPRTSK